MTSKLRTGSSRLATAALRVCGCGRQLHSSSRSAAWRPKAAHPAATVGWSRALAVSTSNVNEAELEKFRQLRHEWWNPKTRQGSGPLHSMNEVRVKYIARKVASMHSPAATTDLVSQPLAGLTVLDVGCGGGLLAEPLARLGGQVKGIDPVEENITVARDHARGDPSTRTITYEAVTAEELVGRGESYDLVVASEVIEHVDGLSPFLATLSSLVKPGGSLVISTINKTPKSFLLAIVGAEYLLRLIPRGTHEWEKFVPPEELRHQLHRFGCRVQDVSGMMYNPVADRWSLRQDDTDVNYIMFATKPSLR